MPLWLAGEKQLIANQRAVYRYLKFGKEDWVFTWPDRRLQKVVLQQSVQVGQHYEVLSKCWYFYSALNASVGRERQTLG